jgi:6-phosphogluconate dehydrogenase
MKAEQYEIGMVGLGVMGRNLLLNMADHGHSVAGYDKDVTKVAALRLEAEARNIRGAADIKEFVARLRQPRAVMMLVPAGPPVDSVINDLLAHLRPGDLIIDAGNSYFKDTDVRAPPESQGPPIPRRRRVGRRGGRASRSEHNARRPEGGLRARPSGAGSGRGQGELNGYLVEITSHIFSRQDKKTGKRLLDEILDVAKQKGTGMWTSQSAMELQVPIPTIDLAVAMRDLSVFSKEREQASALYQHAQQRFSGDQKTFLTQLSHALFAAMIITYAQGMALLSVASGKYEYHLDLEAVARIWRGGCIIRAALLEDISAAFHTRQGLPNLLLAPNLARKVMEHEEDLRQIVCRAAELRIPSPALMVSLGYLDAYRSAWLPANLIQAQRDYFGAHTYERIDAKGTFHTEWEKD